MSAFCKPAKSMPVGIGISAMVGLSALMVAGTARAETCQVAIDGPPPAVTIDYDPFLVAKAPTQMRFRLANRNEQDCTVDLAITELLGVPTLRPIIGATGLMVELKPRGNLGRSTIQDALSIRVPASQSVDVELDLAILNEVVVQSGTYVQDLTLELRQEGQTLAYDQAPVSVSLKALPRAQMNLSGARGDFGSGSSVSVVDFGNAETGKTRQVFIQTRANNQSRLTFRSANQGRLMLVGDNPAGEHLIYEARVEDTVLDLKSISTKDIDPPRTYAGQTFELQLRLGVVEGARSGDYSDELTIEISTL